MNAVFERKARFEHRFWLQILGDHSRFIYEALAPVQKVEIDKAEILLKYLINSWNRHTPVI